jgi:hypothetical protein
VKNKNLLLFLLITATLFSSVRLSLSYFTDTGLSTDNVLSIADIFPTRTPAITQSELYLSPQNLTPDPILGWQFKNNVELKINILMRTANVESETVEAIFNYDPQVISAKAGSIDFTTSTIPELTGTMVQSIRKDANGNEIGQIYISRTTVPLPPYNDPDNIPPYNPIPAFTDGIIGTVTFTPKILTSGTSFSFDFIPGGLNDSGIIKYKQSVDVLDNVINLEYSVIP